MHAPCRLCSTRATSGNGAVVARLLEAGTPANTVERTAGDTPLICAAMQGHTAVVQQLLEAGAWVNVANLSSESALHVAAWEGHKDIVEMLLAAGAEVDQHGPEGETPLLLAADGGHVDVRPWLAHAPLLFSQVSGTHDILPTRPMRGATMQRGCLS